MTSKVLKIVGPVDVLDLWFADSLTDPDNLAAHRVVWLEDCSTGQLIL